MVPIVCLTTIVTKKCVKTSMSWCIVFGEKSEMPLKYQDLTVKLVKLKKTQLFIVLIVAKSNVKTTLIFLNLILLEN